MLNSEVRSHPTFIQFTLLQFTLSHYLYLRITLQCFSPCLFSMSSLLFPPFYPFLIFKPLYILYFLSFMLSPLHLFLLPPTLSSLHSKSFLPTLHLFFHYIATPIFTSAPHSLYIFFYYFSILYFFPFPVILQFPFVLLLHSHSLFSFFSTHDQIFRYK